MKVLLDENLDRRLRRNLGDHEVFTASYMGWDGLKNGSLLRAAEDGGFDVFLTGDQTLIQEQNLNGFRLAPVILSTVAWRIIKGHLPPVVQALARATPGSIEVVDCEKFSRKKTSVE